MNKIILLASIFTSTILGTQAQPTLTKKAVLSRQLLSAKTYSKSNETDTSTIFLSPSNAYTLEVKAKISSASGRGLDIESRDDKGAGYRLSLGAANLKWTNPLSPEEALTDQASAEEQTIRIAVKDKTAYIYQNGSYIISKPLSNVKNIVNGVEVDDVINAKEANLIPAWSGIAPNNTGKPSDYGWKLYSAANVENTTLFNTANSSSGSRYIDLTASTASTGAHTYNGANYIGRIMYIRWDADALLNNVYSFPVTLEANTTYDFSMLHAYVSNATGSRSMTVGIGKTRASADRIASKNFFPVNTRELKRDNFSFTSQEAGQYYITITGTRALYSIAELSINKVKPVARLVLGKNYPAGAVDMFVSAVSYEEGAFAPEDSPAAVKQNVTLTERVVKVNTTFNTNFVVPGKTDLHLQGEVTPLINSSVELNSDDAWLFFDNIKPSDVVAKYLDKVMINGVPAANNADLRIAIYKNGTVLIPNENQVSTKALEVFKDVDLSGESKLLEIDKYHNALGGFDNAIKSFRLKRGYMATFASQADGTGFSRVFIANDDDLVVSSMPEGLAGTVSFIRVSKWDWVSKKGKAGWSPAKINATWYYDWNIAGAPANDYNYVLIRQNGGWPSFTDINNKRNANHLLGFNEPDKSDQANMTVEQCVSQWPELMKSGLRIGSPAPANPESSWITNFLAKTDSLNYRVDYVAIHCYWGGQTPEQWYSRLKTIYNRVKRPLWITEWNNGANWTTETWPTDQTAQFEKQYNDIKGILTVLDTASFVERYAIYDWVQDKRAMVLGDTLTLAGKYYAANKSDFAYNPQKAFVHSWKLVGPPITSTINSDNYFRSTLTWKDLNVELGSKYILERKIDGTEADFVPLQEFTSYPLGSMLSYTDSVYTKASYRVKAFDKDGVQFVYSSIITVSKDAAPVAPTTVTGEIVSATKLKINWNAGANVRSYNVKRSLSAEGPFETILSRTANLTYINENLLPNTNYYYVVTTLNSAGESANSAVLSLKTPAFTAPAGVRNAYAAAGDGKITLAWDFIYDAKYKISRSTAANGAFELIADEVDALRYVDLNRTNGSTYYYKIIAYNGAGNSTETQLQATPAPGQHLYVSFNDTVGTSVRDIWGAYTGRLSSAATLTEGRNGKAVKLDGTALSYVMLDDDMVSSLNDFTVSAWVKVGALSTWARVFDFGTGTSKYMFLTTQAGTTNGQSIVRYGIKNGTSEQSLSAPYSWQLNTWTHLAVTQSGSTVKLYINGALAGTSTEMTLKPADLGATTQNYIGKSQWNDPLLNASVDEFTVYNYALPSEKVMELAQTVLPVKLLSFQAKLQNQKTVLLNWATASEVNNSYFIIQRSTDGDSFIEIAKVPASGSSSGSYTFVDDKPAAGTNYYKLLQVDANGSLKELGLKDVESGLLAGSFKIYPNPVKDSFTLEMPGSGSSKTFTATIYDLSGKQVRQNLFITNANGPYSVSVSGLVPGTYILKVGNNMQKFIKQ